MALHYGLCRWHKCASAIEIPKTNIDSWLNHHWPQPPACTLLPVYSPAFQRWSDAGRKTEDARERQSITSMYTKQTQKQTGEQGRLVMGNLLGNYNYGGMLTRAFCKHWTSAWNFCVILSHVPFFPPRRSITLIVVHWVQLVLLNTCVTGRWMLAMCNNSIKWKTVLLG